MTSEEIIDGLKFTVDMFLFDPTTGETYKEPQNDMDKTAIDACKGAIELLEQVRWIPCSERLPKYNKTVLVSVKQKGKEAMVFTAQRRRRVKTPDLFECCMDDEGWWDFRIGAWDDHEIIAWMPLPAPYKAESEE